MSNNSFGNFVLIPMVALATPAFAQQYLQAVDAQKLLFPEADTFIDQKISLSKEQREKIKTLAGVRQRSAEQPVWRAERKGQFLGWFIIDNVIGKHEFITYATAITPSGSVIGIEIMEYRETHGSAVRNADWRNHFKGKKLQDTFKLDQDVPNISGATLSCRNVLDGVKRLLALQKVALMHE
ncbi:MAG: FMN-binding protein [Gammaproteobacteria bacterium]|nr:FMN-binding protein [Gammaproteobacteria bacterium]